MPIPGIPRFAYAEVSALLGGEDRQLVEYFTRLGLTQVGETYVPDAPDPRWRSADMRRGSFRILVAGHQPGSRLYSRVMRRGPCVTTVAFAVNDLAGILSRARTSGLNVTTRAGVIDSTSSRYCDIDGPGVTYRFLEGGDWGADDGQLGTGAMDHIAVVTSEDTRNQVIEDHEALFGAGSWHPVPRIILPGGEKMDSCYFHAGDVRITIVWPAGNCEQLTGFRAINGGDGIQHVALRTASIAAEVDAARGKGIDFRGGVLADEGIKQIFGTPFGPDRYGPFIELIDRSLGGEGFGGRNIRGLAESMQAGHAAVSQP